jgi:cobalt-zinc-cadmium efflux system membrane fusion protein
MISLRSPNIANVILAAGLLVGFTCLAAAGEAGKAGATRFVDGVRASPDQLHQLEVAKVGTFSFRTRQRAIGRIAYNEDASTPVLTPFSGRVTRLIAKVGDVVKRGDPLFEVDSPEVVLPQNEFIAAIAVQKKARAKLNLATIVEKRQSDLYAGKAAPLKELQQAQADLTAAQNDMRAAETAVDAARNRLVILGLTDDQIAAVEQKRTIQRAVPVYSPIDGTVIARKVGPGQYVRSDSGEALYTIADLSTMWLKALIPENDIPAIKVGQHAEVTITALPGRVYIARITAIEASADPATRRLVVRSEIPNPDGALKSEMFASFAIATGELESSPAVPLSALIREGENFSVWVETEPLVFKRRVVEVGLEQAGFAQIRSGLKLDETIVVRGAIFVDNEWRQ